MGLVIWLLFDWYLKNLEEENVVVDGGEMGGQLAQEYASSQYDGGRQHH